MLAFGLGDAAVNATPHTKVGKGVVDRTNKRSTFPDVVIVVVTIASSAIRDPFVLVIDKANRQVKLV